MDDLCRATKVTARTLRGRSGGSILHYRIIESTSIRLLDQAYPDVYFHVAID